MNSTFQEILNLYAIMINSYKLFFYTYIDDGHYIVNDNINDLDRVTDFIREIWLYDSVHCEWFNTSMNNGKFIGDSNRTP